MPFPVLHKIKHSLLRLSEGKYALLIILVINFIIRLLVYFNTTQFSKIQGSILSGLETLKEGRVQAIFSGGAYYTLSYVAYFFEHYLGSLHWFFVFQCLLSAITSWLVYLIIYKVSNNKTSAISGLIIVTFYIDFIIISSIAYNQVLEVFFTAVAIIIIKRLLDVRPSTTYILLALLLLFTIYISLLFRGTLVYLHYILFIASIIFFLKKNLSNKTAIRLMITFLVFYFAFSNFSLLQFLPKSNEKASNGFIFMGHTLYGGNGGEGTFIYEKNRVKYKKELALYLKEKKITEPTIADTNNFQSREISRFIKNQPLKWFSLQLKKIFYTFGIVPIRDNITILMTGHIKFGLLFTLVLSQVTFILPLIILIVFFNLKRFRELFSDEFGLIIILSTIYLIAATSLYGHYQERYRIVVMVTVLIPLSVLFIDLDYLKKIFKIKRILIYKIIALLLLFTVWGYQAYEALVVYGTRYMNAIDSIHNMKN
jgi:hypothetical protein